MDTMIRLGDLGAILLGGTLFILMVYTVLVLKHLNDSIKTIKQLLEDNRTNIDKVLDQAPSIAAHLESISSDLSHDVKAVQGTIDQILGTTEVAAETLSKHVDVASSIMGVIQFVYVIKDFMTRFRRKKRWFW